MQLRQAQKIDSIGRLAGGIAHDFNNMLAAISGYAELANEELQDNPKARSDIDMILQVSGRAAELVKQILTFSRKSDQKKALVKMQTIVNEVMGMIRSSLPSTIDISTSFSPDDSVVFADPTELHQVVVNLCTNALHAMKNQKGMLRVHLAEERVERGAIPGQWKADEGMYVVLTIEDNGSGMDEETLKHLYEPYYTTKEQGEGTGLGLAMVHGIVDSCGGFLQVKSKLGEGSSFRVYIPVHGKSVDRRTVDEEVKEPLPVGTEHVLLVDDEISLCDIGKAFLSGLGYQVSSRTESLEALELILEDPDRFELIISDQTMPKMTGVELYQAVRKIRPSLPFILCTGYSSTVTESNIPEGIRRYIRKPLTMRMLAKHVREVLDGKG